MWNVLMSISNMRYVRLIECPFRRCRHASAVFICRCVGVECIDYYCIPVRGFSSVQQKILSGDVLLHWMVPRLLNFIIVQNLSRLDVFHWVRKVVLWFFKFQQYVQCDKDIAEKMSLNSDVYEYTIYIPDNRPVT
jgi:hypothetical protein